MRILLVQIADIGDLILTTPAITSLRKSFPEAHITLMASSHVLKILPDGLVDTVIPFEREGGKLNSTRAFLHSENRQHLLHLRQTDFDTVIFFHHFTLRVGLLKFALISWLSGAKQRIGLQNGKAWFLTDSIEDHGFGAKHQAEYWLELVRLIGASQTGESAVKTTPYQLPSAEKRIVIHAGSGGYSLARRWSPERFAQVADGLYQRYEAQIILVGGTNDDSPTVSRLMQSPHLNLTGKTTLTELADVIQQADLFIGADSGVMHIAGAVNTPTVAIFGPSNHQAWSPLVERDQLAIVRTAPMCSPCSYVGHEIAARDGCPARTCLDMVTTQQVIISAQALLEGRTPPPVHTRPESYRHQKRITVLDLPVDAITYAEWLDIIGAWVDEQPRQAHQVCTTNPEFMMMAQKDAIFRNILKRVDLCVPDGVGLLWAGKQLGTPLPQRVTGSDGVPKIAERAAQEGWRLFLLGAAEGVAQKAADVLTERYPELNIVGVYSGSPAPEEEAQIVEMVNASGADILLVAYGAPKQDKWIARNLPRLNVAMAMGVGGTFDFIAGVVPRAPQWMQNLGIEWLYRLYLEPSRIGRMTRLPRFVFAVWRYKRETMRS